MAMAFPKKSPAAKARRTNVSLFPAILEQLDSIAAHDAPRGAEPNRSATIAKLIAKEYARRERVKGRKARR